MAPLPMPEAAVDQWDALSAEFEGISGRWLRELQDHGQDLKSSDPAPAKQLQRVVEDLTNTSTSLFQAIIALQKQRLENQRQYSAWYEDYKRERTRISELASELDEESMREREKRKAAEEQLVKAREDEARHRWMLEESRRELQVARLECRRAWAEVARLEEQNRRLAEHQQRQSTAILSSPTVGSSPLRTVQAVPPSPLSSHDKGKRVFHEASYEDLSVQRDPYELELPEEETSSIGDIEIADSDLQKRLQVLEMQYWAQRAQEQIPPSEAAAGPSMFSYPTATPPSSQQPEQSSPSSSRGRGRVRSRRSVGDDGGVF
ncbi:hypothetical protein POJ06DRAFT_257525 [Lipomyces tetrasporus]|uniref:Uncharacterized protein n=1 Tax=Lipomyces tetrasporus TaxID=54092 RepID=A0AAD7VRG2_9ASCO|nr:uncharacterized protein POJ06DRAFT_257525 [Lipomyces tetrasporus]KAJ8098619.1 hypothetical protein POJ06DRAFT_257525 [Lipomyces tetrasporus]